MQLPVYGGEKATNNSLTEQGREQSRRKRVHNVKRLIYRRQKKKGLGGNRQNVRCLGKMTEGRTINGSHDRCENWGKKKERVAIKRNLAKQNPLGDCGG